MFLSTVYFENFEPVWFWTLLIAIVLGLLVATYAGIYRRSGRRLAWWLLGLRLAGVAVLLGAILKPVWSSQRRIEQRPILAVVVDDSQSMSLPTAGPDGHAMSRYERARQWLDQAPTAERMREKFELQWFGIDGRPLEKLPSEPAVDQTDLVGALEAVAARLRGQGLKAVALLSDGQDTTARPNFLTLQEYPQPVYALGFSQRGGAENTFDLALSSVEAPARVRVHNSVAIKLLVGKDGGPALQAPLVIERGSQVLHSEPIELPAGSAQLPITVQFTPAEAGDFVLTARLQPQPNERTAANNAQAFRLRVEAEPIRVLVVEGTLRSEFSFLRDHLQQDPDVDLATLVRAANPAGARSTAALLGGELITDERLKKIDAVLLGDFEAGMLETDSYKALSRWVDAGGGLMVMGGYENLSPQGLWATPLAPLLPVEPLAVPQQIDRPFQFSLTAEGLSHPAMFLTGNRVEDAALWQSLPALPGVVGVGKARPGAVVLSRLPDAGSDGGAIVLATQSFGKGRVALITADTTWRWSRIVRLHGQPDTLYVRFWSQMVRWLAGRDIASKSRPLTVTTDNAAYKRGDKAAITIRRNPAAVDLSQAGVAGGSGVVAGGSGVNAGGTGVAAGGTSVAAGGASVTTSLQVSIRGPDGRSTAVKTVAASADPDLWTAQYYPDRAGRFEVQASLTDGQRDVANETADFIVRGSSLELDNPSTDPATLTSIARMTGGLYADIDDGQAQSLWLDSLPTEPRVIYDVKSRRLWNDPLVLISFIGLLTGEWFLRRRNQLV